MNKYPIVISESNIKRIDSQKISVSFEKIVRKGCKEYVIPNDGRSYESLPRRIFVVNKNYMIGTVVENTHSTDCEYFSRK